MRAELRHLHSLGLFNTPDRHAIGEMQSNMTFDLGHYVQRTHIGTRAARMISGAAPEVSPAD